jgi:hypothetical protein
MSYEYRWQCFETLNLILLVACSTVPATSSCRQGTWYSRTTINPDQHFNRTKGATQYLVEGYHDLPWRKSSCPTAYAWTFSGISWPAHISLKESPWCQTLQLLLRSCPLPTFLTHSVQIIFAALSSSEHQEELKAEHPKTESHWGGSQ